MTDEQFKSQVMKDIASMMQSTEIHTKRHGEIDDLLTRAAEVVPFATTALDRYRREIPVLRGVCIGLCAELVWRWL